MENRDNVWPMNVHETSEVSALESQRKGRQVLGETFYLDDTIELSMMVDRYARATTAVQLVEPLIQQDVSEVTGPFLGGVLVGAIGGFVIGRLYKRRGTTSYGPARQARF